MYSSEDPLKLSNSVKLAELKRRCLDRLMERYGPKKWHLFEYVTLDNSFYL